MILKRQLTGALAQGKISILMSRFRENEGMFAKLLLRGKEYEAKPGMTLRDALLKIGIQPESVLATRQGEMITDDAILFDGDVIKLIAVISGGAL